MAVSVRKGARSQQKGTLCAHSQGEEEGARRAAVPGQMVADCKALQEDSKKTLAGEDGGEGSAIKESNKTQALVCMLLCSLTDTTNIITTSRLADCPKIQPERKRETT